jgi:hypothetical protein
MYLEDNYDCAQHTNSYREFPKEPVSQQQNTKVSENVSPLQEPNLKRYRVFAKIHFGLFICFVLLIID